jgi:LuxR family maltose regulon positive regulatory protein
LFHVRFFLSGERVGMAISPSTLTELPLLRTKISIPQIPSGTIARPRLTERIHRSVEGPLTLLAAPAGFGKTHLLIEWTKETRLPVAWLTLDSDDNDLGRFFRYLIGALQNLEAGLGEEALEFTQSSTGGGLEVGLTLLINEISARSKEMALVLDDFQVLENPAALQGVGFLLKYLPPNLHLMIASRSEPKLDLAFLRAKGRLVELGADEMRFTGEEVGQYFQQAVGLQLSPETVRALEERTDGWITSLQMAAISLENQADPAMLLAHLQGTAPYLAGFLAEEVLDRQPEEMRQFLLRSSVLETLSGPLCDAVVSPDAQPGYGAAMLNRLERAHLFTTALDVKHEWFRYHPLFADFLRQLEAEVNPGEIPALHERAAMWLEQDGQLDEAFRHALASGDMAWAADRIERNVPAMFNMGEVSTLARWIGRLQIGRAHV